MMFLKAMRLSGPVSLCLLLSGCIWQSNADLTTALSNVQTGAEAACSLPESPPEIVKYPRQCELPAIENNGSIARQNKILKSCLEYYRRKAVGGVNYSRAVQKFKRRCLPKS